MNVDLALIRESKWAEQETSAYVPMIKNQIKSL